MTGVFLDNCGDLLYELTDRATKTRKEYVYLEQGYLLDEGGLAKELMLRRSEKKSPAVADFVRDRL